MLLFLADVRIYSFTVILSVDYLMKVAEFFTSALPKTNEEKASVKTSATKSLSSRSKSNAAVVQESQTQMTINLKIEKPDIILVEHMDNIDANALILNVSIFSFVVLIISCRHKYCN